MTAWFALLAASVLGQIVLVVLYICWPHSAVVRWHGRFCAGVAAVAAGVAATAFFVLMGLLYLELGGAAVGALFG